MKYKKLIVTGCSYTENLGSWAYQLASVYNLELINLASRGAGNKHMLLSLLYYLSKNEVNTEDTLIGIMWSDPLREDVLVEKNTEYEDQSIYKYDYDQYNSRVGMSSIIQKLKSNNMIVKAEIYKSWLTTNNNKSAITLNTWIHIESLITYLSHNNYTFFQTAFLDFLNGSMLIKKNGHPIFHSQGYSYLSELEKINLKQNRVNWIDLTHVEYLGEYAFYTNALETDKIHPSKICAEHWTNKILIPKLTEMKIL